MIGRLFDKLRYEPMAGEPEIPTYRPEIQQYGGRMFVYVDNRFSGKFLMATLLVSLTSRHRPRKTRRWNRVLKGAAVLYAIPELVEVAV